MIIDLALTNGNRGNDSAIAPRRAPFQIDNHRRNKRRTSTRGGPQKRLSNSKQKRGAIVSNISLVEFPAVTKRAVTFSSGGHLFVSSLTQSEVDLNKHAVRQTNKQTNTKLGQLEGSLLNKKKAPIFK